MKTRIMIISILTAACIVVFSGATWAESKNNRRDRNSQKKHYKVANHTKPVVQLQNRRQQAGRSQNLKHRYRQRVSPRGKYHHPGSHSLAFRHKPNYKHRKKFGHYYKPRHYIHRPVKIYHRNRHPRPIYGNTHGRVSILAATSHHGWSIRISSKD